MNKMQTTIKNLAYLLVAAFVTLSFIFALHSGQASAQVNLDTPPDQTSQYEPAPDDDLGDNPIFGWIQFFINVLTVVIIAGAAIMYAVAGVKYTSARDNAQTTQAAKEQIFNTTLGLVAYFFLYGFVQWLIPGGVF